MKNCTATLKVDFSKYFDKGKKETLECCLFAPHKHWKHYNPRLLLTCGGMTIPEEENIPDWSYWKERMATKSSKKKCNCPKGYHSMFENCRGY